MSTVMIDGRCNFVGVKVNYGLLKCLNEIFLPLLTFTGSVTELTWHYIFFPQLTEVMSFHGYLWDLQPMMKYSESWYVLRLAGYICEFLYLNNGRGEAML